MNTQNRRYSLVVGSDNRIGLSGPGDGMGYDSGTLWPDMRFSNNEDALAASKCANEAYRVGYLQAQADIRRAMGVK